MESNVSCVKMEGGGGLWLPPPSCFFAGALFGNRQPPYFSYVANLHVSVGILYFSCVVLIRPTYPLYLSILTLPTLKLFFWDFPPSSIYFVVLLLSLFVFILRCFYVAEMPATVSPCSSSVTGSIDRKS